MSANFFSTKIRPQKNPRSINGSPPLGTKTKKLGTKRAMLGQKRTCPYRQFTKGKAVTLQALSWSVIDLKMKDIAFFR